MVCIRHNFIIINTKIKSILSMVNMSNFYPLYIVFSQLIVALTVLKDKKCFLVVICHEMEECGIPQMIAVSFRSHILLSLRELELQPSDQYNILVSRNL